MFLRRRSTSSGVCECAPTDNVVNVSDFVPDSVKSHLAAHTELVRGADQNHLCITFELRGFLLRAFIVLPRLLGIGRLIPLLPSRVSCVCDPVSSSDTRGHVKWIDGHLYATVYPFRGLPSAAASLAHDVTRFDHAQLLAADGSPLDFDFDLCG